MELAQKYEKTVAQIALNWHVIHRKHLIIPKTSNKDRLRENMNVYDFKLSEEEYASIDKLDKKARFYDPLFLSYGQWKLWPYF